MGRAPGSFRKLTPNVARSGIHALKTTDHSHSTGQLATYFLVHCLLGIGTLCLFHTLDRGLMNSDTCPRSHTNEQHHQNSRGTTAGSHPQANV